ncbi:hypothetical protein THAOC_25917 [Thalassiosira oceanica]|uniref:Uncharacterized protein n=1 Tax=Thalassiosira oceanica TaxID=159749 RepID=K0RQ34_THAOC|nr:hypothetical protein THAOC_25917 [Thalassiosira oceanica]|eukprot:EJK54454.1 hypothetical protein THAOC_25917 [Thalassiosira oceanica]
MLRRLIALAIASAVAPNVLLLCMTGLGGGGHGGGDLFGVASNCHHSHGIYDELHGEQHCGPGPDGPAPAAVGTWSSGAKGSFRLPVASAATYRSSHSAHGGPSAATVLGATVLAAGGVGSGTAASSTRRSMDASDNRTPTTLDAMRLNYGADAPPETLKVSGKTPTET